MFCINNKEECKKPYHRINFFLCPDIDYSPSKLKGCLRDDNSSSDNTDDVEVSKEQSSKLNNKHSGRENKSVPILVNDEQYLKDDVSSSNNIEDVEKSSTVTKNHSNGEMCL